MGSEELQYVKCHPENALIHMDRSVCNSEHSPAELLFCKIPSFSRIRFNHMVNYESRYPTYSRIVCMSTQKELPLCSMKLLFMGIYSGIYLENIHWAPGHLLQQILLKLIGPAPVQAEHSEDQEIWVMGTLSDMEEVGQTPHFIS